MRKLAKSIQLINYYSGHVYNLQLFYNSLLECTIDCEEALERANAPQFIQPVKIQAKNAKIDKYSKFLKESKDTRIQYKSHTVGSIKFVVDEEMNLASKEVLQNQSDYDWSYIKNLEIILV